MKILIIAVVVVVVLLALGLALAVRIVKQYQKGVLFRLGRALGAREPGLRLIIPFVDVLHRVNATCRAWSRSAWTRTPPSCSPPR
jgi:regulator of protease activity HflC (stomatin/prohibitin superfamily)